MNCFNHPQTAAVGLCKNCARGLCHECANDEGFGLACKNRCEAEVASIRQIIERNKKAYGRTAAVYLRLTAVYVLMGLLFFLFPYLFRNAVTALPELRYLFLGGGAVFLLGAVLNLVNASRIKKA